MWSILIALGLGLAIGWFNLFPEGIYRWTDKISLAGLIILLFSMGLGIGGNPEIFKNLNTLGLKAFLIALGSVIGSVMVAWFLEKTFYRGDEK